MLWPRLDLVVGEVRRIFAEQEIFGLVLKGEENSLSLQKRRKMLIFFPFGKGGIRALLMDFFVI